MSVKLIYCSPLWLIVNAIRYSHNNHNKSDSKVLYRDNGTIETTLGSKDFDLIKRVGFKYKHESVLEFADIVYHIECSRAMLQELARHRHISLTVKSTRYTLKELKKEKPFYLESDWHCQETDIGRRASKYLIYTGIDRTDHNSILALERLRQDIKVGVSNDIAKYSLPEAFKTELQLKTNLRELLHILKLRTNKDALWEFRDVAYKMFNILPDEYKELILCDEQITKQLKEIEND